MMPVKENEEYEVPLSLFLPAYTMIADDAENYSGQWIQRSPHVDFKDVGKQVPVDSKPCSEVIDGLDVSDEEKKVMKEELLEDRGFLCPDIESFTVKGGIISDDYKFGLVISRNANAPVVQIYQELDAEVVTSVLTRNFDGQKYSEKGY